MRKSLEITGVKTIFSIAKPIVVFEVLGHEAIVRNPKQALVDLQNSGRALEINPKEFDNGIEAVNAGTRAKFIQVLFDCQGAKLTGDLSVTKAGDKYPISAGHPSLTDTKHPMFGKVKEGDTLTAETDSVWVEGFLSIPQTESEKMRRDVAGNIATAMMQMYGFGVQAPQPIGVQGASTNPMGDDDDAQANAEQAERELADAVTGRATKK